MFRNRTLLFGLALLATISVALSACDSAPTATTQLTDLDRIVNVISYEDFAAIHQHPETSAYT